MSTPTLSMIVPYRDRREHLETFVEWCADGRGGAAHAGREVLFLEVGARQTEARALASAAGFRYHFVECEGVFHKSRALNIGLAMARGELVTPYDIDLVPLGDTLERHTRAALASPALLLTGYRLLSKQRRVAPSEVRREAERAQVAAEDGESALRKQLLTGEHFGHVPMFRSEILRSIGGWDEEYVGWGPEDQDMIERYLAATDGVFARVPEFVYLHLFHEPAPLWNERELVEMNRRKYYAARDASGVNDR
ncbi:MAG TPA: galactosyltransferase-related protein [Pyrinomonadaceae bacterium]|nr:galactosyltransferase-related protein [Pyrinomonadaceae bacterium]